MPIAFAPLFGLALGAVLAWLAAPELARVDGPVVASRPFVVVAAFAVLVWLNNYFDAVLLRRSSIFEEQVRCAMRGNDAGFVWDPKLLESFRGVLHGFPVGCGTHDDANERLGRACAVWWMIGHAFRNILGPRPCELEKRTPANGRLQLATKFSFYGVSYPSANRLCRRTNRF